MKKLLFLMALLLPMGAWADDETVIAERSWTGPSWFNAEGTEATSGMTSEGVTITNPTEQRDYWKPQMCVVDGIILKEEHNYKVLITAKVPSGGRLYVQLGSWEDDGDNIYYDRSVDVEASNEFQDIEVLYNGFPADTKKGHVVFQTGLITGTCTVKNVQVIDITTDEEEIIEELDLTGPYWFNDEGTGATCAMTPEGVAITNPEEQAALWKPQMSVLENFKLNKYHSYKVIINAKIPSDGYLQVQLGSWENDCLKDIPYFAEASDDFQDIEIVYEYFPIFAEDGHVVFQTGGIVGTCIVKSVKIIDLDSDLGDANDDGKVDIEDIMAIAELILSDTYYVKADTNKDGVVDASDLVLLINAIKK